jgi:hypothetical protein
MATNDNDHDSPDPVSRWATEHYGFEADRGAAIPDPGAVAGGTPASRPASSRAPADVVARPRRRLTLIASGVVGLVMISGVGAAAIAAANADDSGRPGGRPADGGRGAVVRFHDDGGRTGGPGGGRR